MKNPAYSKIDLQDGRQLVFLVGCPRSGTTYLQRLLASHPQVKTGQESHVFEYITPLLHRWRADVEGIKTDARGGVSLPCYLDDAQFVEILRGFLADLLDPMVQSLSGNEIFLEKTPSHALHIPIIHELLPEAHFIHIVRDAREVVVSLLAVHKSWGKHWTPDNAAKAAQLWCDYVVTARTAAESLPRSLFYELNYKDLVANAHGILMDIGKFLDLDWTGSMLESAITSNALEMAQKTGGTPITVSGLAGRLRGNVVKEPQGFVRKGNPGNWRTDLTLREKIQVWRVARHTMREFGYDWDFPWQ
ncbi:MAG: sulfotransferase [Chloroflexi bacterium]|nr:sulfotransferase [Chloroflexota bacterium]